MMIYFFKKFNANYSDKDELKKYTFYNSTDEDFEKWLKNKMSEEEIIVEIDIE